MNHKTFLFPRRPNQSGSSLLLLAARIMFGWLLMTHGYSKLSHFSDMQHTFADPFGIGSPYSLSLAIFGELVCPIAFIAGFLYRLSMLPMIVTMSVAFLYAHHGSIGDGELSFAYLTVFILMYFAGPGKFSIDYALGKKLGAR